MKVNVTSNTLFKLSPRLSGELPDSEKVFVKNGTSFELQSYLPADNNHTRLALANKTLAADQKVWYAYNPDIKVIDSQVKLAVVSDTLFKLRPVLSTQLSDSEKVFVKNGTQFDLQSYLPAEGNHVKVAIADTFLGPDNRNTWYVYRPDVRISGSTIALKVVSDTIFKLRPLLSSQLPSGERYFVNNGTTFELIAHEKAENNHVKVILASTGLGPDDAKTWYAYAPDVVIEGNEPDNQPKNETPPPPPEPSPGDAIRLPGFSSTFYLSNPILPNGNFTWGEATKNGSRIPVDSNAVYGIIRIAKAMEAVRSRLGDRPIRVNSWYRDSATNKAVGGASRSRHIVGDAVDFVVAGIHPYDVYDQLSSWWGSRGGLASATVFTHIDARGYYARWSYGF
ncbi:peptidase M15 family protein [Romeria aff. gracilis LEGE 07310]|uniref:Peptidase M15 family protein n=1 Tax=Vasconcelosia minhoensis LEGE 07310 TaxID=915328 RepID=A0A8J7ANP5_9CYAN|nr:D-Ala-D-Ala carboxypeptidase family metallohydrolase [Romeria gracilis]MBE9078435.1 peptidase M15 family protein [Romeria aff. gracilis LEGE 07310]